MVLINEVPKAWVDFEIYCQLIPNNDPNLKTFKILPRIGAFEVSFKGVVSFVYFMINKIADILKATIRYVAKLRSRFKTCWIPIC